MMPNPVPKLQGLILQITDCNQTPKRTTGFSIIVAAFRHVTCLRPTGLRHINGFIAIFLYLLNNQTKKTAESRDVSGHLKTYSEKMKSTIGLMFFILISCQTKQVQKNISNKSSFIQIDKSINKNDSLFMLTENISENFVRIIPPKNSNFEFPDNSAKTEPYKNGDFNADGKEDILVYLGACGTGGCMYGLFINQYDNFYKLAFMDYLKNAEFKVGGNGLWTIKSSEEFEPYNPSKIEMTTFKFDENKYQYEVDTTFVIYD